MANGNGKNSKLQTPNSERASRGAGAWLIPPLVDKDEHHVWLAWIRELPDREVDEVLRAPTRSGEDPSTRLIYELCGLPVLVHLWQNLMSTSIYVSEKPLNELRKRYIRKNYDPKDPGKSTKILAVKLKVSEQFVREALADEPKEDPRQEKLFRGSR